MTYFAQDIAGLALGTLVAALVFILPAFAGVLLFERLGRTRGFRGIDGGWQRVGWTLILALAILPAFDALFIRAIGIAGTLAVHAALVLAAAPLYRRPALRIGWPFAALVLLWWLLLAVAAVDVDIGDRLYQSLITFDMVKHAATIESIAQYGLPLHDPFYARPEPAGYYYYYYIWGALVRWIAGGLVDSRMAFAATAFWSGLAFVALLWRVAKDADLIRIGRDRRFLLIAALLCFVTGLDLVPALLEYIITGSAARQVDYWNEEIRFALTSMMWVPHHLGGFIAAWCGVLLLHRAATPPSPRFVLAGLAGLSFATAFGMSAWIALGAAPALLLWVLVEGRRGRPQLLLFAAIAALVALLFATPQFVDLLHGRVSEGMPVKFWIRRVSGFQYDSAGTLQALLVLALLPIGYALEFGLFALGGNLYLRLYGRSGGKARTAGKPIRSFLLIGFLTSLLIVSFVRSSIINNDLGWRIIWFAQFAAMIWTAAVVQSMAPRGRGILRPGALGWLFLFIGVAGNGWDMVGLRTKFPDPAAIYPDPVNRQPLDDMAQRRAYNWANDHLPHRAILQHNPAQLYRIFDFGLYGRNRVALADGAANLFGVSAGMAQERRDAIRPIFAQRLTPARIAGIARANHIDYLIFVAADPVWQAAGGPPPGLRCLYRNERACIIDFASIAKGASD
ncbi:MAG TPA: hypothetical protein VHO04_18225 [Sphingopyxis sp.]|uniref:hypothetical protein n=1 Tax=Sphingopyxis sp. TaxID=1908224 RepID=UPI002E35C9E2|nr:hypothetical protein [Sphingopyxis sp.]HEX2814619.1 hypothetical protein [Sphingopyxis sp.]